MCFCARGNKARTAAFLTGTKNMAPPMETYYSLADANITMVIINKDNSLAGMRIETTVFLRNTRIFDHPRNATMSCSELKTPSY